MKTIGLTGHNLEEAAATAAEFLSGGGVVMLPTDTAYALAADATNEAAVQTVFSLKGRADDQRLSVVVPTREQAGRLGTFSPPAERLWAVYMPGPLTLVVPLADGAGLAPSVTGGQSVGLRQVAHPFTQLLAERFGRPFTATSANRSGHPPAFQPGEFLEDLEQAPHLLVDAGDLPINPVSTVVRVAAGKVEVLREGAIAASEIEKVVDSEEADR